MLNSRKLRKNHFFQGKTGLYADLEKVTYGTLADDISQMSRKVKLLFL